MSVDNPSYEHQEGTRKFTNMESQDPIAFTNSSKSKNRERILILILVILFVISLAFIILYAKERNDNDSSKAKGSPGSQGGGTIAPTTLPNATSAPTPTSEPDYGPGPWTNVRIPTYFIPNHYDLTLVVNLEKLIFSGDVSVNVHLTQETPYMYLHTNKLNISSPTLKKDGKTMELKRHFWYEDNEFYVMEAEQNLTSGVYVISMEFVGKLDNDLKGLYRSTYKNKNGTTVTIATTQLQPTDARKVFPCFDEPSFKATFTVTMVRPKDMISISNMPQIRNESRGDNMVADFYQKTVKMPTYLLAFIVCDFDYLEDTAGKHNNVSMKYYTTKGQIDQAEYAKSIGGLILNHFENYFNISYPLPKADMIAVPDFAAGAMENWGLIIYRETAMLFKDGQSSEGNRERIVQVVAHELAHMWFGNLVTTAWWDDLWLNEGFASFVEYIGMAEIYPDWNMNDMFVNLDMKSAFTLDALVTSHPILLPVNHPDEINEIFDSISYNKGSTIIRMLQYFLTEEIFRAGLINYLNAHAYGNAKTKDLWNYLTMASRDAGKYVNVAEVMDTWTLQMGFPVVNVTEEGGKIVLKQQRFLADLDANISNTKFTSDYGYKWHIPFTIAVGQRQNDSKVKTAETADRLIWMNRTSDETRVLNKTWNQTTQWVKGNVGQTGFYRVNYPTNNWELLAEQLLYNHSVFSLGDRAGLILDAFALADAGLLEFKYALELTRYLVNETNYIPWDAGYASFSSLTRILPKSEKIYKGLQKYRFDLMKPNFDRLGFFDNGTHLEKYLRVDAVYAACGAKNEDCMQKTKDLFDQWIANESYPLPPDLRSVVYLYGMSRSGEKEWDITFERLQKTNVASERRKLMYGLAGISEPWILNRYLQYAFDETKIKSQDTSAVISYVANVNPIGRHFAWNFLKEKWPDILEKYGKGFGFSINRFVNGVASSFSTEWELEELENLFKKYPDSGSGTRAREQLLETVRGNIKWRSKYQKPIEEWLNTL